MSVTACDIETTLEGHASSSNIGGNYEIVTCTQIYFSHNVFVFQSNSLSPQHNMVNWYGILQTSFHPHSYVANRSAGKPVNVDNMSTQSL